MNPSSHPWRRGLLELAFLLGCSGALWLITSGSTPEGEPVRAYFWTAENGCFLLAQGLALALGAVGMALVLLAGGVDFSAGAGALLSGGVAASLLMRGISLPVAIGGALFTGVALGGLNALGLAWGKAGGSLGTLGTFAVAQGLALSLTGSHQETLPLPTAASGLAGMLRGMNLAPAIGGVFLLTAGWAFLLRNTVLGRHIRAIGCNEEAARLCGVRVCWTKGLVYLAAGGCFALAGLAELAVTGTCAPQGGLGRTLAFLTAAMLGGIRLGSRAGSITSGGSVFGALCGGLALTALQNGMAQAGWPLAWQETGLGLLFITALGINRIREQLAA